MSDAGSDSRSSSLLFAVAAGLATALLYLSASSGQILGLLLANFTPLPIFVAGLSLHWQGAAIATATATLVSALFGTVGFALNFLLVLGLVPVWLVRQALLSRPHEARETGNGRETGSHFDDEAGSAIEPALPPASLGREFYPAGRLLIWVSGLAAALLLLITLAAAIGGEGLLALARAVVEQISVELSKLTQPGTGLFPSADTDPEGFARAVEAWAVLVPVSLTVSWMILMIGNGLLAQAMLRRAGRAVRPAFDVARMSLPLWTAYVLAGAAALSFLGGTAGLIGTTLAAIAMTTYFLFGLAVIHAISRPWSGRPLILAAVYLLVLGTGWPIILAVSLVGLAEQWLGLRRRIPGGTAPD